MTEIRLVENDKHVATMPDLSALDSPRDRLAESLPAATVTDIIDAVMSWHKKEIALVQSQKFTDETRMLLSWLSVGRNKVIRTWALLFALQLECLQGRSISSVAREIGTTKANLSKEIQGASDTFHLRQRSRYLKSETSRSTYRHAQLTGNHWRNSTGLGDSPAPLRNKANGVAHTA
jgi:hypothetical protein